MYLPKLFFVCSAFLILVSCNKKNNSESELDTLQTDKFEGTTEKEFLENSNQETVSETYGVFKVGRVEAEFSKTSEKQFLDACVVSQKYFQSPQCIGIDVFETCCNLFEEERIRSTKAPVERKGNELKVRLADGNIKVLTNSIPQDIESGDEYIAFVFVDYFPSLNVVYLDRLFYEGGDGLLIDLETGDQLEVYGDTKVSPDGKKLVSYSCDMFAGFRGNGIQLLERKETSRALYPIVTLEITKFGPEEVCWLDNNTLLVKQLHVNEQGETTYHYAKLNVSGGL